MRIALLVAFLAALVAAPVLAAPQARPRLLVRPAVVQPGGTVRVSGNADGCPRGDAVAILSRAFSGRGFAGVPGFFARVGTGGAFAATGRVRATARPGRYVVTARCGGGNLGVRAYVRVR